MPTASQLRQRLIDKLQELFQLNQPDLDFGFYKIMHAKAEQVTKFIDQDLLKIIETAFGTVDEAKRQALQVEYEQAVQLARNFGAPNPEETDGVKAIKAKLAQLQESGAAEAEIYDHLYRFFSRYYNDGDFLSQRFYGRETAGKAATYAIPYAGEEVKLHWANADQFYIKTAEYFNRYTVNLREAKEVKESQGPLPLGLNESPLRVTFNLVAGSEGEHGNVKAGDNTKRFFRIDEANPVQLSKSGELLINFVYRPDPEKTGTEGTWREKRNQESCDRVLAELEGLAESSFNSPIIEQNSENRLNPAMLGDFQTETLLENRESASNIPPKVGGLGGQKELYREFLALLQTPAPTEKQKDRPLLAKYINQYTARNTMDYFIHKDLGSFLRRELDFYIKNEVMRLDDIENADCPAVESYLAKVKVLRSIARQLIDFLAQLENFQKKLWLKKKFVTETNYCLTLDRVPESFYPEIVANEDQREEWVRLFAIDEIQESEGDLLTAGTVGYSVPLTVDFLRQNRFLVLDTAFFSEDFKGRLLASIDNFDDQCDGLLIHSENFQALNLLQERYREQVKCVYIDPPYNTDSSAIIYKNDYKNSSWISLIENRVYLSYNILSQSGIICLAIDDEEMSESKYILKHIFDKQIGIAIVRSNPQTRKAKGTFSPSHEYAIFYGKTINSSPGSLELTDKRINRYPLKDEKGRYAWMNFIRTGTNDKRVDRPKLFYPIFVDRENNIRIPDMEWNEDLKEYQINDECKTNEIAVYPTVVNNNLLIEKRWHRGYQRILSDSSEYRVRRDSEGKISIDFKTRIDEVAPPSTWWDHNEYASSNYGASELKELFENKPFDFAKAKKLVEDCIRATDASDKDFVIDFFGGSGTTGEAVININRKDEINIKYILVEMGDYFDPVLKPRIQKVIYAQNWKDGKPKERDSGVSHCFKYLRLESYEDTLNNLELNPVNSQFLQQNEQLQREYLLHYLLDIETKGSQSLLNIDNFANPSDYRLKIKIPGTDEYQEKAIDLIETFNYLIGLRVIAIDAPQQFTAEMERQPDPELPAEQLGKLVIKGKLKNDPNGQWWFRKIEGTVPKNPHTPNDGLTENVLIVWRNLTGDLEQDNLILDEWFQQNRINPKDFEYDIIYVNGSNNLPNLLREEDHWKVRLIEETFHQKMWDMGGF